MSDLNLQQIVEKMKEASNGEEFPSEEIREYFEEMDRTGGAILRPRGKDYVADMMSVISSATATALSNDGYDPFKTSMILTNDVIVPILIMVIKLTIGISIMEELK